VHVGVTCLQGMKEHWFANRTKARTANRSSARSSSSPLLSSSPNNIVLIIVDFCFHKQYCFDYC
jgi:hypothetical protein